MGEVRASLGLGRVLTLEAAHADEADAMEVKLRSARLLGIAVNCVGRFKQRTGRNEAMDPHST